MCVIKVYEFELLDYHKTEMRFFGEERACVKPECKCGKIKAFVNRQSGGNRSSCDILNTGVGKKVNETAIPQQLLYVHFPTKITPNKLTLLLTPSVTQKLGYCALSLIKLLNEACNRVDEVTFGCGESSRQKVINTSDIRSILTASKEGFLLHFKTRNDLIVIGDLHGSFHTFWRHILRLRVSGIITSLKTFSIRDGITIVFTGDITDRGLYALDILIVVLKMIVNNKSGAVLFNRGNHESFDLNLKFGFWDELLIKFGDNPYLSTNELEVVSQITGSKLKKQKKRKPNNETHKAWNVLVQLQRFYNSCPCAIVIENKMDRERLWISHGGIPTTTRINLDTGQRCIPLTEGEVEACMWYDFFTSKQEEQEFKPQNTGRTRIYPKYLRSFMKRYKLSFIIRGHQDSYANTYLLSNQVVERMNASGSRFDLLGAYKQKEGLIKVSQTEKTVDGPIARVYSSPSSWLGSQPLVWDTPEGAFEVYPVIVLATCTELGRYHMKDSFIYVSFNHNEKSAL